MDHHRDQEPPATPRDEQRPNRPGGAYRAPPPPQPGGAPSQSELLPFKQKWDEVRTRPYFLPAMIAVGVAVALFANIRDNRTYLIILGATMLAVLGLALRHMIGKRTPIWTMVAIAVLSGVLVESPLMGILQKFFAIANIARPERGTLSSVYYYIFRAGFPEEVIKSIPILIGAYIALKVTDVKSVLWKFRVAEPLDGMLVGASAGLGFSFVETVFQYAAGAGAAGAAVLIPRVISELCGHAGWAAITGYFVGLAVMNRGNWLKTIGIGLGIAVILHAGWDGMGGPMWNLIDGVASVYILLALIVKAREISPNRDALVRSSVLERASEIAPIRAAGRVAGGPVRPLQAGPADAQPVAQPPRRAAANPLSDTWGEAAQVLVIALGSARIPAASGARLYDRQTPGLKAQSTDGIVAEVNANPNDPNVLGVKNLSQSTWVVTTDSGERRELAPGRSIRIARGTRLHLGDVVAEVK